MTDHPKRSGGPQTPQGKAISSGNALKTGVYSRFVVLPGEDEQEFQELVDRLSLEFQTEGVLELALVRDLSAAIWRRLRLERLEKGQLLTLLELRPKAHELRQSGICVPKAADLFVDEPEMSAHLQAKLGDEFIPLLRAIASSKSSAKTLRALRDKQPSVYEWLMSYAERTDLLVDTEKKRKLISHDYSVGNEHPDLTQLAWGVIEAATSILWVMDHSEEIEVAAQTVKEARLLSFMQKEGLRRAHDDLSRSFYRNLAELRKHIEWRQKNAPIDVTPKS